MIDVQWRVKDYSEDIEKLFLVPGEGCSARESTLEDGHHRNANSRPGPNFALRVLPELYLERQRAETSPSKIKSGLWSSLEKLKSGEGF